MSSQRSTQSGQSTYQFGHWMGDRSMAGIVAMGLLMTSCTPSQPLVNPSPSPQAAAPTASPTVTVSPSPTPSPTATPTPVVSPVPGKPENVTRIETQISDLVTKTAGVTVQSVSCPTAINEKAGNSYDCNVQSDVGAFVVVVQPTGEAGKFRWSTRGLLLISKLDAFIQQSVANRGGGKVAIDCGGKARIVKQGETFECKVTDAKGAVRTARVTVRDEQGNVYLSGL